MFVVKYRKLFFGISATLVILSIVSMIIFGFNFGIDFKGGTVIQVSYSTSAMPSQTDVQAVFSKDKFENAIVQPTGNNGYIINTHELSNDEKSSILNDLSFNNTKPATLERYNSIGPVVGNELTRKAFVAIAVVLLGIVLFITYAFRKVSEPVASWKYGLAAVIALTHDVIIPTGIYVLYTHYHGGEIDLLFVSALLAILGYSVHDTIVVFDRVREHLHINKEKRIREEFPTTVGKSVSETFGRSINTSLTIFLVLLALFIFGGQTTQNFALILLIGVIVGTYSSIFVASPILVTIQKMQDKKNESNS